MGQTLQDTQVNILFSRTDSGQLSDGDPIVIGL